MSFIPFTEKNSEEKNWSFLVYRKRIRGSGSALKWSGSETLPDPITEKKMLVLDKPLKKQKIIFFLLLDEYWIYQNYQTIILRWFEKNTLFFSVFRKFSLNFNADPDTDPRIRFRDNGSGTRVQLRIQLDPDPRHRFFSMRSFGKSSSNIEVSKIRAAGLAGPTFNRAIIKTF